MNRKAGQRIFAFALFSLIAFVVALLVLWRETVPQVSLASQFDLGIPGLRYTSKLNDDLLGVLCGTVGLLLLGWALRSRLPPRTGHGIGRTAAAVGLTLLASSSALAYFYGSRGVAQPYFAHFWDQFHTFVGAKYHDELGYDGLYECAVAADDTGLIGNHELVTELRTYRLLSAAAVRNRAKCSERFTAESWAAFKRDLSVFRLYAQGQFPQMLGDYGYNGTPLFTLVAGKTAHLIRAEFRALTLAGLVDVVALCALMSAVCWAFGWRLGFLFAIFFFVNFSDRFAHVGGSYLRYLWLVALGLGMALLKRRCYGSAAASLTASAVLNAFPLLFFAGIGGKALMGLIRRRRLSPEHARFFRYAAATAVLLGVLGASQGRGPADYLDFASKMTRHVEVINRNRVGLEYLFPSRSTVSDREHKRDIPGHEHSRPGPISPVYYGVVLAVLLWGLALIPRLDDIEATALGGVLLLFLLFGAVQYYYACSAMLVLFWHRRVSRPGGVAMVALLFLLMTAVYAVWHATRFLPLCDNTATSLVLAIYLLLTLAYVTVCHAKEQVTGGADACPETAQCARARARPLAADGTDANRSQ